MTTTLKTLRTTLGGRMGQPFFRRYGGATLTSTGGTTTTLIDTANLKQADNFWRGQFLYLPATNVVREISAFTNSTSTITFLEPTASIGSGVEYEIWSQFTGVEVNDAINQALSDTWPFFFDAVEDYLVIRENSGARYALSSLTTAPRIIASVYMEHSGSSYAGQVTTEVAQNRLKDTGNTFTSADVGKSIRIYAGTSVGDYRTITSLVDANTVEVNSNFTAILTATSKYRMVDESVSTFGWEFITTWAVDRFTNPSYLIMGAEVQGYEGYRYRLLYEADFTRLTTETSATACPREFVELAAAARIYFTKISLAPATEVSNWNAMYRASADAAHAYALQNRYRHLATTYVDDQVMSGRVPGDYPFSG